MDFTRTAIHLGGRHQRAHASHGIPGSVLLARADICQVRKKASGHKSLAAVMVHLLDLR